MGLPILGRSLDRGKLAFFLTTFLKEALNLPAPRTTSMSTELLEELVEAGVHYGHQRRKWNPKMKPFLLEQKNSIYIINLFETVKQLDVAASYLAELAANGKRILFVGCKRQAQESVREAAEACNQFYINHRWLGGTLTNMSTIRKSVQRLDYLEKPPEKKTMSKKELAALGRERSKLLRNLEGIRNMEKPPDAVVVVDSARECIAVKEAQRLNIPVVALVDTNADPDPIAYPIAANDDALRSIRIILQKLIDPVIAATQGGGKFTPAKRAEMEVVADV